MPNGNAALSAAIDPDAEPFGAAANPCAPPSLDRQLARLDRLAEAGMEMVEALTAQAKGSGPKVVEGDVALAFGRVSRAVRLAVLLYSELTRGDADPDEIARQAEAGRRQAQVDRTVRIVKRVAAAQCPRDPFAVSAYAKEAAERLDNDDIYGLVASRPLGALIAMICEDLGLQPDWDHLAAEAWAQAEIASGAEGSPFLDADADHGDDEESAGPEPGAARPAWRPPTFQEALLSAARDPAILAAARRESG
jgi:hypothetical protein